MRSVLAVLTSAVGLSLMFLVTACSRPNPLDKAALLVAAQARDARVIRDEWGVPHIFGATDADTAFGLAYAHCEDDFPTFQEIMLAVRGELASVRGKEAAPLDYMGALVRGRAFVEEKYQQDLRPETRELCEAYAEGINLYAALHPGEIMKAGLFPVTGRDVVAGFVLKAPLFFRLDHTLKKLFEAKERAPGGGEDPASKAARAFFRDADFGSNAFAVAPSRSADGATRLAINSHQPWTGPVAWYEAHLHSGEGLDIVGGTFPGSPVILHGHNRNLGWAHTVNLPDLADVYELEMNPDNRDQYRFDGEWRTLEKGTASITVKLLGPIRWTFRRELLWSVHGPAVRTPDGRVCAVRYAGYGDIRQVEQWFLMGKARNVDEWMAATRMRAVPSFNSVYADRDGNICYLYNALLPLRREGLDWKEAVPGNTSENLWSAHLPFDALPQVVNPASGYVVSCNHTPFRVTADGENPDPAGYDPNLGIETLMTNRGLRALELYGGDPSITREEFFAYKHDLAYSMESEAAALLKKILEAPPSEDPVVREAVEVLRGWDMRVDRENKAAAIAVLTMEPVVRARFFGEPEPDIFAVLKERAHLLKDTHGQVAVPWGDVNRMRRGAQEFSLSGGPDVLRAVYGRLDGGKLIGHDGDSYILMVEWDKEGRVHSESVHQFGSATLDEKSPHFADQAPLFAEHRMKPVIMEEEALRRRPFREYKPGGEHTPPAPS